MFFRHCLFELELCTNCSYILLDTRTSPVLAQRQCHSGRLWLVLHGGKHVSLADIYPCMYRGASPFFHTRIHSKAQMPQILLHNCGGTPCGDRYVHHGLARAYTDKKENEIFLIYSLRKLRWDRLQSHI